MNSFEAVWSRLLEILTEGTTVRNWTAFHGYLGDTMTVIGVHAGDIAIKSPNAKNAQSIPKDDFLKVWDVWIDYKAQKVQRQEVRDITHYSKYIISILHWLENA